MRQARKGFIGRLYSQQTREKTMFMYKDGQSLDFTRNVDKFREATLTAAVNTESKIELDFRLGVNLYRVEFKVTQIG